MRSKQTMLPNLRVGFVGSGFIAHFHLRSMVGVRNVTLAGVFSRDPDRRRKLAEAADAAGLGPCRPFASIGEMASSGEVDAIWILTPNHTRLAVMGDIHAAVRAGGPIRAVACEKPLARNLTEAREMLRLAEDAGLLHGYLENQLFSTAVMRGREIIWRRAVPSTGRPYLARAAEEHSGPHEPWFWQGEQQGGGVLSDMMCHSVEVARHLLDPAGKGSRRAAPGQRQCHHRQPEMDPQRLCRRTCVQRMGIDFARRPVEDFARGYPDARRRRRPSGGHRGNHVLGLCRCRPAHPVGTVGAGILDGVLLALDGPETVHVAGGHRRRPARIWWKSRTPSRG